MMFSDAYIQNAICKRKYFTKVNCWLFEIILCINVLQSGFGVVCFCLFEPAVRTVLRSHTYETLKPKCTISASGVR